jgi:hypothetical protein
MLDPFNILFLLAVLIDLSVLCLAVGLLTRAAFRSKAYWLLAYALATLIVDYATAIVKIDRALGRGGALFERVALPRHINLLIDLSGRIALLIAIWLFLVHFIKAPRGDSACAAR